MKILRVLYGLLAFFIVYRTLSINWTMLLLMLLIYFFLFALRRSSRKKMSKSFNFESIDTMDGFLFENLVTQLYRKIGYQAATTKPSGDYGADVIAENEKERLCIQCKRWNSAVGIEAVQQVIGAIKMYDAQRGIVLTNNYFTAAAKELARVNDVELIDRRGLCDLLNKVRD